MLLRRQPREMANYHLKIQASTSDFSLHFASTHISIFLQRQLWYIFGFVFHHWSTFVISIFRKIDEESCIFTLKSRRFWGAGRHFQEKQLAAVWFNKIKLHFYSVSFTLVTSQQSPWCLAVLFLIQLQICAATETYVGYMATCTL